MAAEGREVIAGRARNESAAFDILRG